MKIYRMEFLVDMGPFNWSAKKTISLGIAYFGSKEEVEALEDIFLDDHKCNIPQVIITEHEFTNSKEGMCDALNETRPK